MGTLNDIVRSGKKAMRAMESERRKLEAKQRKEARTIQMIIASAERMIKVANESLRMANDPSKKLSTRIGRLYDARYKLSQLQMLRLENPFWTLDNLKNFENDIAKVENKLRKDPKFEDEHAKYLSKASPMNWQLRR
jgi:hypothetical protein